MGVAYHHNDDFTTALIYYKKAAKLGHQGCQNWLKKNGHDWGDDEDDREIPEPAAKRDVPPPAAPEL